MAPGGLVEVRVSWPGHPRYLKKKKKKNYMSDILLGCKLSSKKVKSLSKA